MGSLTNTVDWYINRHIAIHVCISQFLFPTISAHPYTNDISCTSHDASFKSPSLELATIHAIMTMRIITPATVAAFIITPVQCSATELIQKRMFIARRLPKKKKPLLKPGALWEGIKDRNICPKIRG